MYWAISRLTQHFLFLLTCCLSSHHSYSTRDGLMGLSRIAVAASLVFSYPLAFVGARDGVLELFNVKNRSNNVLNTLTVGMLSAITIAALLIPDVSFVLAFAGCVSMEWISFSKCFEECCSNVLMANTCFSPAPPKRATLGNALIYIFPGIMFRGAIKKLPSPTSLQKTEVKIALGSAVVGAGLGILGAIKAVQSIL